MKKEDEIMKGENKTNSCLIMAWVPSYAPHY